MSYEPSLSRLGKLSQCEKSHICDKYLPDDKQWQVTPMLSVERGVWVKWGAPNVFAFSEAAYVAYMDALLFFMGVPSHAPKWVASRAVEEAPAVFKWRALEHGFKAENDAVVRDVVEAHEKRDDESERMGDWCAFDKELRIHERN